MDRQVMGVLMAGFGIAMLGGALFQWRWFVAGRKYQRLAASMGPNAPRWLYGIIGGILVVFGVLNVLGLWQGGLTGRG